VQIAFDTGVERHSAAATIRARDGGELRRVSALAIAVATRSVQGCGPEHRGRALARASGVDGANDMPGPQGGRSKTIGDKDPTWRPQLHRDSVAYHRQHCRGWVHPGGAGRSGKNRWNESRRLRRKPHTKAIFLLGRRSSWEAAL